VFDVVVGALGEMVGAGAAWLVHFDSHGFITNLGVWSTRELSYPIGTRQDLSDEMRAMRDGRRPFRVDVTRIDPDSAFAGEAQRLGIESAVGVPVLLGGQVWALAVVARFGGDDQFDSDTETRMTSFLEPVTAALANALARAQLHDWHPEQSALRRLTDLASTHLRPDELFQSLVVEASALVNGRPVMLARLDEDQSSGTVIAASDALVPVGSRFSTRGRRRCLPHLSHGTSRTHR
jgi:GAF domain-containing protein